MTTKYNQDHIDAAEEVMNFARATGNTKLAEMIKDFFDIQEKPVYDDSTSVFKVLSQKYNIGMNIQGYKTEKGIRYPYYSAEGDIREFEKLHNEVKQMRVGNVESN
jgi:hypothetical protein